MPRAKITAPSARGLVPRRRLFARLASKRARPITWITGPPGAGKTSLAASFVHERSGAHLWLRLDVGDADPATLFAGVQEACERVSRRRRPALPPFGPEYGQDLLVYSRRFFEAVFQRLRPGTALVLDDYHEIPPAAPAHEALREGLSVVPPGIRVLVLSRQPPPPRFARLQAEDLLERLDWEELRLTPAEAKALVRARCRRRMTRDQSARVLRMADGWPAGLVLLSASEHGRKPRWQGVSHPRRELLFDYFASEVFEGFDPELRLVAMRCALLPRCTAAQAQALSGLAHAGGWLRTLARSGYFTVVRGHDEHAFELHPLFREFLLHRAAQALPADEWARTQLQAAELMEASGDVLDAYQLYRELGACERQVALIQRHARVLLRQGQVQTLRAWIEALPPAAVAEDGWLSLWAGLCQTSIGPEQSRASLERAFARLGMEGDAPGQMLAWCALVDTWLYTWSDFPALDSWIRWLDANVEAFERLDEPAIRESVTVSMTWALVVRQPDHPDLPAWLARAERILREGSEPPLRLRAGLAAVYHRFPRGERAAGMLLFDTIRQLAADQRDPLAAITSHWIEAGVQFHHRASSRCCLQAVDAGLAASARSGIHAFDHVLIAQAAAVAIEAGDRAAAREALARTERVAQGDIGWALFHYLSSWSAFMDGKLPAAIAHAERSLSHATASGMPSSEALTRLALVDLLFESGRLEEARRQRESARALVTRLAAPAFDCSFHLGEARRKLDGPPAERGEALKHLRRALALGREHELVNFYWWVSPWMARLCLAALQNGIEVGFAQRLIHLHELRPPAPSECPEWPWELRVTTLGRFAITRHGEQLAFRVKAPRKVLLLLKALTVAGRDGIGEAQLADWLWPDSEGDALRRVLDTSLHRLRQVLGVEGAVVRREGRVSLDPCRCWVDAIAFESLLKPPPGRSGSNPEEAEARRLEQALALHSGPFLPEVDEPWAYAHRERLRERLRKAILRAAKRAEDASDHAAAVGWYERGLEADPSAEPIYRRLMSRTRRHP